MESTMGRDAPIQEPFGKRNIQRHRKYKYKSATMTSGRPITNDYKKNKRQRELYRLKKLYGKQEFTTNTSSSSALSKEKKKTKRMRRRRMIFLVTFCIFDIFDI